MSRTLQNFASITGSRLTTPIQQLLAENNIAVDLADDDEEEILMKPAEEEYAEGEIF